MPSTLPALGTGQTDTVERGTVTPQAGQHRMHAMQVSPAQAGADLAGIDKLMSGVTGAEQQYRELVQVRLATAASVVRQARWSLNCCRRSRPGHCRASGGAPRSA
jgi:hypothetical protein